MKFNIGDKVSVIDEAISGVVVQIDNTIVCVETSDGFILEFSPNELIKTESFSNGISTNEIIEVIKQKEFSIKKKSIKVKPKARYLPAMEVDLHIHKLTSNERQMTNYDMLTLQLDVAKQQLEFAIRKRIRKVVFIHGVGEGVLKMELDTLFRRYDNIKFYDADLQKYGNGATEVYIYQNLKL
ncbi:Smr/MutS family protein [uncultured Psychroserpens sp.]|uniref:Smr/MutS family protein n=1 Tax=uncultured Psychroserpens sp. TaxID=255436 RepID=UPI00261784BA|nr:Smr/MutS family protein [uncultured Psychroserpens sp.]